LAQRGEEGKEVNFQKAENREEKRENLLGKKNGGELFV